MRDSNGTDPVTVLDWARRYVAAGLSVIPIRLGGSKAPVFAGWREFSDRLPTDAELVGWFTGDRYGIGIPGGKASGNLAVLDFEAKGGLDGWADWMQRIGEKQRAIVAASPVVVTPSGGRHLYLRLANPHPGTVLARTPAGNVLIEIRGDKNFVVAPGSPAACHKTGATYKFEQRGWLTW